MPAQHAAATMPKSPAAPSFHGDRCARDASSVLFLILAICNRLSSVRIPVVAFASLFVRRDADPRGVEFRLRNSPSPQ